MRFLISPVVDFLFEGCYKCFNVAVGPGHIEIAYLRVRNNLFGSPVKQDNIRNKILNFIQRKRFGAMSLKLSARYLRYDFWKI
ncbi:MAG: hypothetical protein U0Z17_00065 [Bacteroidales bacterium]